MQASKIWTLVSKSASTCMTLPAKNALSLNPSNQNPSPNSYIDKIINDLKLWNLLTIKNNVYYFLQSFLTNITSNSNTPRVSLSMHRDTLYIVFLLELTLLNIMAERKPWTDPVTLFLLSKTNSWWNSSAVNVLEAARSCAGEIFPANFRV